MNTGIKKKSKFLDILHLISTIISWTVFVLLVICCILLIYYFISLKIYETKGSGYEPKFSLYTIVSPSMVPNINVYDVIVDVKVDNPEEIEIGDVITFNSSITGSSGTITHRVIAITIDSEGNYYYRTKGDNNLVDDGIDIPYSNVVGKVALRIPQLGRVQSFMASSYGWLLLILIPALYIILKDLLRILRINAEEKANARPSKFRKLMTKQLISFKPKKLLPAPDDINMNTEDKKIFEEKDELSKNNTIQQQSSIFFDEEDDIDIDDLPKLK